MEKKGQLWETMMPWIIAIAVLVLMGVFAFLLREQLAEIAGRFKGILR